MENEYSAHFTTSRQISEDSWKVVSPCLKVTDKTTIGEIRAWIKNLESHNSEAMIDFTVTQLHKL